MLFIIVMLTCIIASIFVRKTRILGFLGFIVLAYIAGDADPLTTIDYPVYLNHYNLLGWEVTPFEKGYTQLSLFFSNHGFNYAQFRLAFAFLALLILFIGVSMFTKNVALFAGLYGVTVFFNDATQIRNLMMISLVVLASGLLAKKNFELKILGCVILWLSTQFHDLGFLFLIVLLPLSFIDIKLIHRVYKYIVTMLFGFGFVFSIANSLPIIQLLSKFLAKFSSRSDSANSVVSNFGRGNSNRTVIIVWLTLLLFSIVLNMLMSKANSLNIEKEKLKMLYLGSSVTMLVTFLIVLAPDYSRVSRNAFLFFLILICVIVEKSNKIVIRKSNMIKFLLVFSVLILTAYVNTTIWGSSYYESIPYLAKVKK